MTNASAKNAFVGRTAELKAIGDCVQNAAFARSAVVWVGKLGIDSRRQLRHFTVAGVG